MSLKTACHSRTSWSSLSEWFGLMSGGRKQDPRLNPGFTIAGQTWFLATQAIGAVRGARLVSRVCSLGEHEDAIVKAVDHLLLGS